jgi:hypothetical protein
LLLQAVEVAAQVLVLLLQEQEAQVDFLVLPVGLYQTEYMPLQLAQVVQLAVMEIHLPLEP